MDWTDIETHWDTFAPQINNRWGRLTERDIESARAGRDALLDRVLRRYGIARDLAARHVDDWINSASPGPPTNGPALQLTDQRH